MLYSFDVITLLFVVHFKLIFFSMRKQDTFYFVFALCIFFYMNSVCIIRYISLLPPDGLKANSTER